MTLTDPPRGAPRGFHGGATGVTRNAAWDLGGGRPWRARLTARLLLAAAAVAAACYFLLAEGPRLAKCPALPLSSDSDSRLQLRPSAPPEQQPGAPSPQPLRECTAESVRSQAADDARIIVKQCSSDLRQKVQSDIDKGGLPWVMSWGSENEQCGGDFVDRTTTALRQNPHYKSLLTMVPCDLFTEIQGRTLWLVGDSQAQRFYRQVRYFLDPFLEPEPRRRRDVLVTDDPAAQELIREELLKGWDCCGVDMPVCTHLVGETRVCHIRTNKGDHLVNHFMAKMHVLNVSKNDIWNINFGLWHHKRDNEYAALVASLADFYKARKEELPQIMWRDNSPQHFDIADGEFPHPDEASRVLGDFTGCKPMQNTLLLPNGHLAGSNNHVMSGGWRNQLSNPLLEAVGMPIHATWNDTVDMWDGHTAGECSHFCSPGAYNVWVWSMWRSLRQLRVGGVDQAAEPAAEASLLGAEQAVGAVDLRSKADQQLQQQIADAVALTPHSKCAPGKLKFELPPMDIWAAEHLLLGSQKLTKLAAWATVTNVPCRSQPSPGLTMTSCCSQQFSFRFNSTDIWVFQQIYTHHFLKSLYAFYESSYQPQYILDAGANAGFSTSLFKLLFPNATVVAVEPDLDNFVALQRNTRAFSKVHVLNAGLWGRHANITVVDSTGDWGKIFSETSPGEAGTPAYTVAEVAAMFNITAFDYVKMDIEGAEGMVFAPDADVSWIQDAQLVSLEVHDGFAMHFGLMAVSPRVDAAFNSSGYTVTADNEHIFFIAPDLVQRLRAQQEVKGKAP